MCGLTEVLGNLGVNDLHLFHLLLLRLLLIVATILLLFGWRERGGMVRRSLCVVRPDMSRVVIKAAGSVTECVCEGWTGIRDGYKH